MRQWAPAYPGPCDACQQRNVETDLAMFGCGFRDEYRGRATVQRVRGATDPETRATCPWYFYSQPFVNSIYEDLSDYKAGRLGSILRLPAPYVDYLRALVGEHAEWETVQTNDALKATKR